MPRDGVRNKKKSALNVLPKGNILNAQVNQASKKIVRVKNVPLFTVINDTSIAESSDIFASEIDHSSTKSENCFDQSFYLPKACKRIQVEVPRAGK